MRKKHQKKERRGLGKLWGLKKKQEEEIKEPQVPLFQVKKLLSNGIMAVISNGDQVYVDPDFLALGEKLHVGDWVYISGNMCGGHKTIKPTAKIISHEEAFPHRKSSQAFGS